jgi:thiosulfate reductase cytochrome b subunit
MRDGAEPIRGGDIVYRHRRATRLWHWLNALTVFVMLMSGLMIFNAHPRLYWGRYGANFDTAWLEIGNADGHGYLRLGQLVLPTGGVLGGAPHQAFPPLVTIPSHYNLAGARQWHFAFAWLLVVPGLAYWLWCVATGHLRRDLAPAPRELAPRSLWHEIKDHARLRFPTGEAARHYNVLQKLSYLGVIFGLLPLVVLTGLTMSPSIDAAWPWLLGLFGGRPSARSIHFIAAAGIAGFIAVHLVMVVLAGPLNEIRSMITGRYRLPAERPE